MAHNYQASRQWERINRDWVTEQAAVDLTNFKSERPNHKIALWDPAANGVRYLKALIYNLAAGLGPDDWNRLRRTRNRDLGNPITVRWDGESVCLDYLQAVLEVGFIERNVDLRGADVLEIGAGYGRTCHTLLSNHAISTYCVVDLETTMRLSKKYLRAVLDERQFAKITFVAVADVDDMLDSRSFDLCVNIDSLAEMAPGTARNYLTLIDRRCAAFYVKNPVGKYLDKSLDGHLQGDEVLAEALESGLIRQVLDVHDNQAVRSAVPNFISAYRPGDGWSRVADGPAAPWSFYWQAVYENGGHGRRP